LLIFIVPIIAFIGAVNTLQFSTLKLVSGSDFDLIGRYMR